MQFLLARSFKKVMKIELGKNLKLPPDYFQLIIVDECHRSIYGKWKKVLDYFSDAILLNNIPMMILLLTE